MTNVLEFLVDYGWVVMPPVFVFLFMTYNYIKWGSFELVSDDYGDTKQSSWFDIVVYTVVSCLPFIGFLMVIKVIIAYHPSMSQREMILTYGKKYR